MKTYDIIAFGELFIDFHQQENGSFVPSLGGSPANLIYIPAKCGLQSAFISKIGMDRFGKKALQILQQASVDTRFVQTDPNGFTTLAFTTEKEGHPVQYERFRNSDFDTQYKKAELPVSILKNTKIFHFSSFPLMYPLSREAAFEAVHIARQAGAVISFEASYCKGILQESEAKKHILQGIKDADVVTIAEKDLNFLGVSPMDLLHQYSSHFIFINMGKNGCRYVGRDGEGYVQGKAQTEKTATYVHSAVFIGAALSHYAKLAVPIKQLSAIDLESILHFASETAASANSQQLFI